MPKLIIASIPRSGRRFVKSSLDKLGVKTKEVEGPIQVEDNIQVVFTHDFTLDLYLPDRYTIRLQRNPEECIKSWFLLDTTVSELVPYPRLPYTKEVYEERKIQQLPYILKFNNKYGFNRTMGFRDILDRPNDLLEEICYIIRHPFIPLDIPKHTPRDLNIYPFV